MSRTAIALRHRWLPRPGLNPWALGLGLWLGVAGCGNTSRNGLPGGPFVEGSATSAQGGTDASGEAGAASSIAGELQVVPGDMHRLNALEHSASIEDTLGLKVPPLAVNDAIINGFDNNGSVQVMQPRDYELFHRSAQEVAAAVFADGRLRTKLLTCEYGSEACADELIERAGLRLFRRPLRDEERAVYTKLYAKLRAQGQLALAAQEQVLVALLSSAQFLYRMEFSTTDGAEPLDPYEQASRLSYLLWSSAPDDELLEAARLKQLSEDEQLEAQLLRLWSDVRSDRFVQSFAGQWLELRRLTTREFDAEFYPQWSPIVAGAAAREVYASFDGLLRQDRELDELYRGTAHEVDPVLAPLYGVQVGADGKARVEGERAGFLGTVAYFALTSQPRRSSPMLRGRFVLDQLVCEQLPPPPPNVPPIEPEPENLSLRARYERIRTNPACGDCHRLMDPIGLALEHYDAVGQYRSSYRDGELIDSNIQLPPWPGHPEPLFVSGISGVVERVTADRNHVLCAAQNIYNYAIGGMPTEVDEKNVAALTADWAQGPLTFKQLVRQLVLSKTFRYKLARKVVP